MQGQVEGGVGGVVRVQGAVNVTVIAVYVFGRRFNDGVVKDFHDEDKEERGEGATLFDPFFESDLRAGGFIEGSESSEVGKKEPNGVNDAGWKVDVAQELEKEVVIKGIKGLFEVYEEQVVVFFAGTGGVVLLVDGFDIVQNITVLHEAFLSL